VLAALLAVDDGIWSGKANLADIFFLIGAILFGIAAVFAYQVKTFYATLISAGLCLVALGWLVL
jgi:VIT1/CCC1 family predicted Fe2+/Mn2+ transporter